MHLGITVNGQLVSISPNTGAFHTIFYTLMDLSHATEVPMIVRKADDVLFLIANDHLWSFDLLHHKFATKVKISGLQSNDKIHSFYFDNQPLKKH
jgi:hypothetical protein